LEVVQNSLDSQRAEGLHDKTTLHLIYPVIIAQLFEKAPGQGNSQVTLCVSSCLCHFLLCRKEQILKRLENGITTS
jgi:hypothetical protein